MNWFQRHLNWTWFLASLLGAIIVGAAVGILTAIADPYGIYYTDSTRNGLTSLLSLVVSIIVGAWALRQKSRSLWWLLILFVPFGWIVFLCLENRSNQPALQV
jgi:H+/Cl- antiporter ClcA